MVQYEIFLHVRRICDRDEVHTSKYEADPRHTYNLLRVVDSATARKFAKTYNLKPEDKVSDHRHA